MAKELQRYRVRVKGITHTAPKKADLVALLKVLNSNAEIKKLKKPYRA